MAILPGKKAKNSKQAWLEWLSDDVPTPVAQAELRQRQVRHANQYVSRDRFMQHDKAQHSEAATSKEATPAASGVSIQISLPEFKKPQFKRSKAAWVQLRDRLTKRQLIAGSVIILIILASWIGAALTRHKLKGSSGQAAQVQGGGNTADVASAKPAFTPAVPSTKKYLATPDTTHSRYDATKQSYSFLDSINNKQFTVSEQQLLSASSAQTAAGQAAKSLSASQQLTTGWGTAYLATNAKYNSQTLVFNIKDLLVFIQSPVTLETSAWTSYINGLQ